MDAVDAAASLRGGEVSAAEACRDAIGRIEALNTSLNAVVIPLYDRALDSTSAGMSGPFAGVPILLKDFGACLQGLPLYQGASSFAGLTGAPWRTRLWPAVS